VFAFVTARSAFAAGEATVVVIDRVLFEVLVSVLPLVALTELVRIVPLATVEATRTTTVNVTVVRMGKLGLEQRTVPAEPTAGVTQDQPAGGAAETKVVPGGRTSVTEAFGAAFGPRLRSWKV
jgi:hypothetical protein